MALRRKPEELPKAEERAIEAVIGKGGGVATEAPKKGKQQNYPLYFMRTDMRERIDAARGSGVSSRLQSMNGSTRPFLKNWRRTNRVLTGRRPGFEWLTNAKTSGWKAKPWAGSKTSSAKSIAGS